MKRTFAHVAHFGHTNNSEFYTTHMFMMSYESFLEGMSTFAMSTDILNITTNDENNIDHILRRLSSDGYVFVDVGLRSHSQDLLRHARMDLCRQLGDKHPWLDEMVADPTFVQTPPLDTSTRLEVHGIGHVDVLPDSCLLLETHVRILPILKDLAMKIMANQEEVTQCETWLSIMDVPQFVPNGQSQTYMGLDVTGTGLSCILTLTAQIFLQKKVVIPDGTLVIYNQHTVPDGFLQTNTGLLPWLGLRPGCVNIKKDPYKQVRRHLFFNGRFGLYFDKTDSNDELEIKNQRSFFVQHHKEVATFFTGSSTNKPNVTKTYPMTQQKKFDGMCLRAISDPQKSRKKGKVCIRQDNSTTASISVGFSQVMENASHTPSDVEQTTSKESAAHTMDSSQPKQKISQKRKVVKKKKENTPPDTSAIENVENANTEKVGTSATVNATQESTDHKKSPTPTMDSSHAKQKVSQRSKVVRKKKRNMSDTSSMVNVEKANIEHVTTSANHAKVITTQESSDYKNSATITLPTKQKVAKKRCHDENDKENCEPVIQEKRKKKQDTRKTQNITGSVVLSQPKNDNNRTTQKRHCHENPNNNPPAAKVNKQSQKECKDAGKKMKTNPLKRKETIPSTPKKEQENGPPAKKVSKSQKERKENNARKTMKPTETPNISSQPKKVHFELKKNTTHIFKNEKDESATSINLLDTIHESMECTLKDVFKPKPKVLIPQSVLKLQKQQECLKTMNQDPLNLSGIFADDDNWQEAANVIQSMVVGDDQCEQKRDAKKTDTCDEGMTSGDAELRFPEQLEEDGNSSMENGCQQNVSEWWCQDHKTGNEAQSAQTKPHNSCDSENGEGCTEKCDGTNEIYRTEDRQEYSKSAQTTQNGDENDVTQCMQYMELKSPGTPCQDEGLERVIPTHLTLANLLNRKESSSGIGVLEKVVPTQLTLTNLLNTKESSSDFETDTEEDVDDHNHSSVTYIRDSPPSHSDPKREVADQGGNLLAVGLKIYHHGSISNYRMTNNIAAHSLHFLCSETPNTKCFIRMKSEANRVFEVKGAESVGDVLHCLAYANYFSFGKGTVKITTAYWMDPQQWTEMERKRKNENALLSMPVELGRVYVAMRGPPDMAPDVGHICPTNNLAGKTKETADRNWKNQLPVWKKNPQDVAFERIMTKVEPRLSLFPANVISEEVKIHFHRQKAIADDYANKMWDKKPISHLKLCKIEKHLAKFDDMIVNGIVKSLCEKYKLQDKETSKYGNGTSIQNDIEKGASENYKLVDKESNNHKSDACTLTIQKCLWDLKRLHWYGSRESKEYIEKRRGAYSNILFHDALCNHEFFPYVRSINS